MTGSTVPISDYTGRTIEKKNRALICCKTLNYYPIEGKIAYLQEIYYISRAGE